MESDRIWANFENGFYRNKTEAKNIESKESVKVKETIVIQNKSSRSFKHTAVTAVLIISLTISVLDWIVWKANTRVQNALKDDRPCNFLLNFDDIHLLTPEIIQKYGYPVERHWVTTRDGYILEMHRLPQVNSDGEPQKLLNVNDTTTNTHQKWRNVTDAKLRPAVLLLHGIMASSRDFVINCDKRALAFFLWENGYDVWLGNFRGNPYSRNHTSFTVDTSEFWDYSVDDVAQNDLPAMIDYVLNSTNLKQLSIAGHSMGNGIGLIMLTTVPEYNDKINIWFSMSGSSTVKNTNSPFLRLFLAPVIKYTQGLLKKYNRGELFPGTILKLMNSLMPQLCRWDGRVEGTYHGFCSLLNFLGDGYNPGQIPPRLYAVMCGGAPTSTSVKFLSQWLQWIDGGNVTLFDDGPENNLQKYGTETAPAVPLKNFRVPTVIMYAENDWIITSEDVREMKEITRNVFLHLDPFEYLKIEHPLWNHLSYNFGKDADIHVYSHILKRLEKVYSL